MAEPEYHEIEFTAWECNSANLVDGCATLEPILRVQSVLDPYSRQKIGLYFQHRVTLISKQGIILNCAAEHVFISPDIFFYSCTQMKALIETAHLRFKTKLLERTTTEHIPFTLDCCVNHDEVGQIMQQLK